MIEVIVGETSHLLTTNPEKYEIVFVGGAVIVRHKQTHEIRLVAAPGQWTSASFTDEEGDRE